MFVTFILDLKIISTNQVIYHIFLLVSNLKNKTDWNKLRLLFTESEIVDNVSIINIISKDLNELKQIEI